ncbi:hypothetical protein Bca52824_052846 [Brassica carinata]|uniref:Uncharacterized protein n=1 Tax=Brassica carinata TaxID=52824 RepID=A0A8X7UL58_BRACI|nr:hypothetical protein Bca52824_052846 [Brassica carinata]
MDLGPLSSEVWPQPNGQKALHFKINLVLLLLLTSGSHCLPSYGLFPASPSFPLPLFMVTESRTVMKSISVYLEMTITIKRDEYSALFDQGILMEFASYAFSVKSRSKRSLNHSQIFLFGYINLIFDFYMFYRTTVLGCQLKIFSGFLHPFNSYILYFVVLVFVSFLPLSLPLVVIT